MTTSAALAGGVLLDVIGTPMTRARLRESSVNLGRCCSCESVADAASVRRLLLGAREECNVESG